MIKALIVGLFVLAFVNVAREVEYEIHDRREVSLVRFELACRAFCYACTLFAILALAFYGDG